MAIGIVFSLSRRDDMFIENAVATPLEFRRNGLFIFDVFINISSLPNQRQMRVWHLAGLKSGNITFNYKHSVPTGLKRVSGIEYNP